MSTTKTRIPLEQAIDEAERFRALFEGCYDRWEFAGSVRRKRDTIGDIEHVVISQEPGSLFDADAADTHDVASWAKLLIRRGILTKHIYPNGKPRFGDRLIGVVYHGRVHEIYLCDDDNWGNQLLIRTGSADFSQGVMARLTRRGYAHENNRLFRIRGVRVATIALSGGRVGELIPCPTEGLLLEAAGLVPSEWPPEKREVAP